MKAAAQIVIAGAGPVGLTAALALCRLGIDVVVLEAETGLPGTPRASTFHPPTLEMFDELGVGDAFLARGFIADRFQFREHAGDVVATFDLAHLRDVTRFPFRLQCPQDTLTALLLDAVRATGRAEIRFGVRVDGVEPGADGVRVRVEIAGRSETLAAAYLIGADGARSNVRRALKIPFAGESYPVRQVQMMTTLDLRAYLPDLAPVAYVLDPDEWFILLHTPPGVWRALAPVPAAADDEAALDESWMREKIRRLIKSPGAAVEIVYRAVYTAHQRVAARFRAGRVMLAGDAAHVNSPFGGMGVNCGVHDAYFLAPALAAALRGGADDALDRWAGVRRDVALDYVQQDTAKNTRDAALRDEGEREARNDGLRRSAADPEAARRFLLRSSMIESVERTRAAMSVTVDR